MSGFINKKSRFLDYKLSENGRSQLASGDIRFKYFTFSDRSIVYHNRDEIDGQKISSSEFSYLPFEVTTDPGLQTNPEYYLTGKLTYDNPLTNFFTVNSSQKNLVNNINAKSFLTTKTMANLGNIEKTDFVFDALDTSSDFNFYDEVISRKYPTVYALSENIENIETVREDQRFDSMMKFKKMIPVNQDGTSLIEDLQESADHLKSLFKTLDIKNSITKEDSREDVITKSILSLEKNSANKLHYLNYVLNSSTLKADNVFHFEMHEVLNGKLNKLPFINLGRIFDKKRNKYLSVFIVGKFLVDRRLEENFNEENRTGGVKSILNYKFINMFTVIVE